MKTEYKSMFPNPFGGIEYAFVLPYDQALAAVTYLMAEYKRDEKPHRHNFAIEMDAYASDHVKIWLSASAALCLQDAGLA